MLPVLAVVAAAVAGSAATACGMWLLAPPPPAEDRAAQAIEALKNALLAFAVATVNEDDIPTSIPRLTGNSLTDACFNYIHSFPEPVHAYLAHTFGTRDRAMSFFDDFVAIASGMPPVKSFGKSFGKSKWIVDRESECT